MKVFRYTGVISILSVIMFANLGMVVLDVLAGLPPETHRAVGLILFSSLLALLWFFPITVEDETLTIKSLGKGSKRFDLTQVDRLEKEDKVLVLHFADGKEEKLPTNTMLGGTRRRLEETIREIMSRKAE